jgi:uncharacterized protein GlcG (DUF336 family)
MDYIWNIQMKPALSVFAVVLFCLAGTEVAAAGAVTTKKVLTLAGARQVLAAAVAEAQKSSPGTGAIAVVDDGGNLIAVERLDSTFPAAASISIGKARTAAQFGRPTRFFEEVIRNGRTPMLALVDFTPLQGGLPIVIDGQIVSAIGVSGAASAQADEGIAMAALAAVLPATGAASDSE